MDYKKIVRYWVPVFIWIGFIYWMSTETFSAQNTYLFFEPLIRFFIPSISKKGIFTFHTLLRKLAHVTEYMISGFLLFRAFRKDSNEKHEWRWAFTSLLILAFIALSDEFHQTAVPSRTPSMADVGIDVLGGFLAQCVSVLKFQRNRQ